MSITPSFSLAGQVALVTGASSGLGHACAVELARAGAQVVVNCHPNDLDKAQEVVSGIHDIGGDAIPISADVSDQTQVQAMFAQAIQAFGTLHILVNNAGIQQDARFTEMSLAQWQRVINVNLTGQFLCAQEACREFIRRGVQKEVSPAAGKIICMSSVHQAIPWAGHVNYAASKGGVMMLMESLAQEMAAYRIRVNAIAPGAVRTPINRGAWDTKEALDKLLALIPYGRIGEPEDIGRAAVWLASDASDYITGTTLIVDGGMMLYSAFNDNG
ncbi:MAG: SDR family oxidoreductase [Nitrospirota bacterium]|nr:SDR family oxidoreductase [Nitrospirota bacterium]